MASLEVLEVLLLRFLEVLEVLLQIKSSFRNANAEKPQRLRDLQRFFEQKFGARQASLEVSRGFMGGAMAGSVDACELCLRHEHARIVSPCMHMHLCTTMRARLGEGVTTRARVGESVTSSTFSAWSSVFTNDCRVYTDTGAR